MKKQLAALAVLFLLAHLFHLPPTLEDIDSVNFALGVRDFDVARHQPHPPGYPVFIALGKASTAVLQATGADRAAVRALALLSVVAGAALVPLLFVLFRQLSGDAHLSWWAMAVAVCSPLFWFTALRPLSDTTGLAFAVAAQAMLLRAVAPEAASMKGGPARALWIGAALAGVAAGVRVQTVMLTAPLLVALLCWPRTGLALRDRAGALAAAVAGAVVWIAPLLFASGGVRGYLDALGAQAGEDFSGVVMLWTTRQSRVAANAVLNSFVWPWREYQLGIAMVVLAAVGFMRLGWRAPRALGLLLIGFGPYAVFHLLFHETATVRYALPLVVPVAFLATYAAGALGRIAVTAGAAAIVIPSLLLTLPAARAYARDGSPAFAVFQEAMQPQAGVLAGTPGAIGMHAAMRRVADWEVSSDSTLLLRSAHGREWLALVEFWRGHPDAPVRFVADPRRTDLALFDSNARALVGGRRWSFPEMPFVAGIRPGNADWYAMRPPGWMLDRGWALTAEVAGVTSRDQLGPHRQPAGAWVRGRPDAAELIVGGRHLGSGGDPAMRLSLSTDRAQIDSWEIRPGFFFRHVALPAGTLAEDGYVSLRIAATPAGEGARPVPVALEQFDVQSAGTVMFGFLDGWHEPEYNPSTARAWHWMSEAGRLWVRPVGRPVTLTVSGESPLRYFDRAPKIRAVAGGIELAQFSPTADFTQDIVIPADALTRSGGLVTLETDLWFTPQDRGESADRRHLALRIYSISVKDSR